MTIYNRSPAYLQRGQSHPTSPGLVRDKEHNWKSNIPIVFHFQKLIYLSMQSDKGLFPSVLFFLPLDLCRPVRSGWRGPLWKERGTYTHWLHCLALQYVSMHCHTLLLIAIYNAIYIATYFAISCSYALPPHCPPFWVAIAQVATGFPPGTMEIISGNRHEDWAAQLIPLGRLWYLDPEREKWQEPIRGYLTFATNFYTCRTMQPGNPKN